MAAVHSGHQPSRPNRKKKEEEELPGNETGVPTIRAYGTGGVWYPGAGHNRDDEENTSRATSKICTLDGVILDWKSREGYGGKK